MFLFTIQPDDGERFEVEATSRDVRTWEKTNRGKTMAGLQRDLSMVDLYRIAHIAARRQGLFTGSLQEFEESCDLDVEEADEPDPTPPAHSTER